MSVLSKTALKAAINSQITANGTNSITGTQLNAILNNVVDSYEDGIPQKTEAQIALLTPTLNQLVYNTDRNYLMQYNGTIWIYLVAMFIGTSAEVAAATDKAGQLYYDVDLKDLYWGTGGGRVKAASSACCGQFNYFLFGQNKTTLPNTITASVRNLLITNTGLTTLNTGAIKEGITVNIASNSSLGSITLPSLENGDDIAIGGNDVLTSIVFSALVSANLLTIDANDLFDTLSLSLLQFVNTFSISDNIAIENISMPQLESVNSITIAGNTSLETIALNSSFECPTQTFTNNALIQATVDYLLDLADDSGLTNGSIDLSGGTNATPSASGLTSKSNLVGKGWTVTNN